MTVIEPAGFETASRRQYGPRQFIGDGSGGAVAGGVLAAAGLFIAVLVNGREKRRLWAFGVLPAILLAFAALFPIFASCKSGGGKNWHRLVPRLATGYKVEVIGPDSKAVASWLRPSGGSVASNRPMIEAYARQGWCFAVAKIRRGVAVPGSPKPLALEFRTSQPVYPLRLGRAEGQPRVVDLLVVADAAAEAGPLKRLVSRPTPLGRRDGSVDFPRLARGADPINEVAWPGATVSRLHRELGPNQAVEDAVVRTVDAAPDTAMVGTRAIFDENRRGVAIFWFGFALLFVGAGTALKGYPIKRRLAIMFLVAVVAGGLSYFRDAPRVEPVESNLFVVSP
jgi:hypothetical protein